MNPPRIALKLLKGPANTATLISAPRLSKRTHFHLYIESLIRIKLRQCISVYLHAYCACGLHQEASKVLKCCDESSSHWVCICLNSGSVIRLYKNVQLSVESKEIELQLTQAMKLRVLRQLLPLKTSPRKFGGRHRRVGYSALKYIRTYAGGKISMRVSRNELMTFL